MKKPPIPTKYLKACQCILRLGLFMILLPIVAFALDRDRKISQFHHTSWTAKDGAPSQISALTQTTDGYLWIGSALGLYRFDGFQFEQYNLPDSVKLPAYNIYTLLATPDNGLWISFRPSGLGFLKDGNLQIFSRPEELPKSQVYKLARTPDGKIWAGTHDGLSLFNGSGWTEIGSDWNFTPSRVRSLFIDREGTLWVCKENGMAFLPVGQNRFQELPGQEKFITQLAQANEGNFWGAEFRGYVSKLNLPEIESQDTKLHATAKDLLFDRDGSLWLNTYPDGIRRVRFPQTLEKKLISEETDERIEIFREAEGLTSNAGNCLFEDREGNIWVGTEKGLDRFRYSSIVPVILPTGFQKVTILATENGEIWVGSAVPNPILRVGVDGIKPTIRPEFTSLLTSSVYKAETGDIWWGGFGSLMHQQNEKSKLYQRPPEIEIDWIWEVFRGEKDGGLWLNYGDLGLIYFKDGVWSRRKTPEGLPERGPSASFQDIQKRIWLGYTENRVFVIDDNSVKGYTNADGIEIGRIKVIRGRGTNLWFGGERGLAFLTGGKFWTVKTEGTQLESVSGIVETASGDLWLNEIHGIIHIMAEEVKRLTENTDYAVKYRLYDFQDNLPGGAQMNYTVSTAVEATDGKLWFATDNGLARIDPSNIKKNTVPPPVLIKSVTVGGKFYEATAGNLEFPAGTENLRIDYTALSFVIPERVQFKFHLEGLDGEWREAGNRREAFYTNLRPGNYRFQVIAANNDGVWNEQGAILEFKILPKFYQTSWFLFLCLAAFGFMIWTAYKWRVYFVESRLKLQFEERLAERTRIAQDLHDTLLQGVAGISMQLDVAVDGLPANLPVKSNFKRIRELFAQVIVEGRNTVNGLRLSGSGETPNIERELSRLSNQLNARGQTDFRISTEGVISPLSPAVYDEVFHICREAIVNAFRHSEASVIETGLEYADEFLKITIQDNGIGIDPKTLKWGREDHMGLSGMRKRAETIGAKLTIDSRAGEGTKVELTIPKKNSLKEKLLGKLKDREKKVVRNHDSDYPS